jgi:hypothetical protein
MRDGNSNVWLEVYRYTTSLMGWLIVFRMVQWLKAFRRGLLRQSVVISGKHSPQFWWFVMFCGIGLITLAVALGNMYSAYRNFPFNPISTLVLPGEITFFIGLTETYDFVKSQIDTKGDSDD